MVRGRVGVRVEVGVKVGVRVEVGVGIRVRGRSLGVGLGGVAPSSRSSRSHPKVRATCASTLPLIALLAPPALIGGPVASGCRLVRVRVRVGVRAGARARVRTRAGAGARARVRDGVGLQVRAGVRARARARVWFGLRGSGCRACRPSVAQRGRCLVGGSLRPVAPLPRCRRLGAARPSRNLPPNLNNLISADFSKDPFLNI